MYKRSADVVDTIVRATAELRALERYVIEVIELQQHERELRAHEGAAGLLDELMPVLCKHVHQLDRHLELLGDPKHCLRAVTGNMAGAFLGFITKLRSHDPAKILRDDYILLSLLSFNYLTLHTTAMALSEPSLSQTALQHHADLQRFIAEVTRLMPQLTLHELSRHFVGVNEAAVRAAHQASDSPPIAVMEPPLAASA
jgi:hypothetical protein